MCQCTYELCIAAGIKPFCMCTCHGATDLALMQHMFSDREDERCEDCRWAARDCALGQCYCGCHGDRPTLPNPMPVVRAGHDLNGHERSFTHLRVQRSVSPDLDILIRLHQAYSGTHPEWTIGGSTHVR